MSRWDHRNQMPTRLGPSACMIYAFSPSKVKFGCLQGNHNQDTHRCSRHLSLPARIRQGCTSYSKGVAFHFPRTCQFGHRKIRCGYTGVGRASHVTSSIGLARLCARKIELYYRHYHQRAFRWSIDFAMLLSIIVRRSVPREQNIKSCACASSPNTNMLRRSEWCLKVIEASFLSPKEAARLNLSGMVPACSMSAACHSSTLVPRIALPRGSCNGAAIPKQAKSIYLTNSARKAGEDMRLAGRPLLPTPTQVSWRQSSTKLWGVAALSVESGRWAMSTPKERVHLG